MKDFGTERQDLNKKLANLLNSVNFQNIIDSYNQATKDDKNFTLFSWNGLKILINAIVLAVKELPSVIAAYDAYKQGFFNDIENVTALLSEGDISNALATKGNELGEIAAKQFGINKEIVSQLFEALKQDQDLQKDLIEIGRQIAPTLRAKEGEKVPEINNQKVLNQVINLLSSPSLEEFRFSLKESLTAPKVQEILEANIRSAFAPQKSADDFNPQNNSVSPEVMMANQQFAERVIEAMPIALNVLDNVQDIAPVVNSLMNGGPLPHWAGHSVQMILNNPNLKTEIAKDPEKISNLLVALMKGPLKGLSDSLQFDPEILDIVKVALKDPEKSRKLLGDLEKGDALGMVNSIKELVLSDKEVAKEMRKYLAEKPEFTQKVNKFVANLVIDGQVKTTTLLPEMLLNKEELISFKNAHSNWQKQMNLLVDVIIKDPDSVIPIFKAQFGEANLSGIAKIENKGDEVGSRSSEIRGLLYAADTKLLNNVIEKLKSEQQLTAEQTQIVNASIKDFDQAKNNLKVPFEALLNQSALTVLGTLDKHWQSLSGILSAYNEQSFAALGEKSQNMTLEQRNNAIAQDLALMKNILVYLKDNQDLRDLLKNNPDVRAALEQLFENRFANMSAAGYDMRWFVEKTGIDIARVPVIILDKCDIFAQDDKFKYIENLYNAIAESDSVKKVFAGSQVLYQAGIISAVLNMDTAKSAMNVVQSVAGVVASNIREEVYKAGADLLQQAKSIISGAAAPEEFHDAVEELSERDVKEERISSALSELIANNLFKAGKSRNRIEDTKLIKENLDSIVKGLDEEILNKLDELKPQELQQIVGDHSGRFNRWIKMSEVQQNSLAQLYYSEATENTYMGMLTGGVKIKAETLNNSEFQQQVKNLLEDHEETLNIVQKSHGSGMFL